MVDLYDCFARKYVNEVLSLSSITHETLVNFKSWLFYVKSSNEEILK